MKSARATRTKSARTEVPPLKSAATRVGVIKKGQFFDYWINKFASSGPYNVYAGPKDCGAVMLGPNKAVYSVAFDGPGLPLRKVLIPDAKHTCANHLAPAAKDELHLAKYGEPF